MHFNPREATIERIPLAASDVTLSHVSCPAPLGIRAASVEWSIAGWRAGVKRSVDVLFALLLLTLFALPMCITAVAIKLDSPGPVLFKQRRIGWDNRPFRLLKFRTMQHHAPELGTLRQTRPHDPRVTRVGAMLRHTSLDEIPQLLHVLCGEMSLVGPRPHAPGSCAGGMPFEYISDCYPMRHRVRPGMTGLAQVRGLRGETDTQEKLLLRLDSDLEYIETWSLWLDIVILARTVGAVLRMRNAY
jgi:lipopolysaccharide/colanic/teichoic acid biosynthesis glycosyltransferase